MAELYGAGITFHEADQVSVGRGVQQLLDDEPGLASTADGAPVVNHGHGLLSWHL